MVQRFRYADQYHGSGGIKEERLAQLVGRTEKAAQEHGIEQRKNEKQPAQIGEIGVHHGILGVNGRLPQRRQPYRRQKGGQQPRSHLDEDREKDLGLYYIPLFTGQQRGIQDIIAFPGELEGIKNPHADKKSAHQNGIPRDHCH